MRQLCTVVLLSSTALADKVSVDATSSSLTNMYRKDVDRFGADVTLSVVKPDYSSYKIYGEFGDVKHPKDNLDINSDIGFDFTTSVLSLRVGAHSGLVDSPLFNCGYNFSVTYSPNDKMDVISYAYTDVTAHQPKSHIVLPDFTTKWSPTKTHSFEHRFTTFHALNEWSMMGAEWAIIERPDERPNAFDTALHYNVALSDSLFLKNKARFAEEELTQLKNERGYYSLYSATTELSFEPIYNLYMSAAVGYILETENDTRDGRHEDASRIGYGLSSSYKLMDTEVRASVVDDLISVGFTRSF